jgi:hypothetical protein
MELRLANLLEPLLADMSEPMMELRMGHSRELL